MKFLAILSVLALAGSHVHGAPTAVDLESRAEVELADRGLLPVGSNTGSTGSTGGTGTGVGVNVGVGGVGVGVGVDVGTGSKPGSGSGSGSGISIGTGSGSGIGIGTGSGSGSGSGTIPVLGNGLCKTYKAIYSGTKKLGGFSSQTYNVQQLGNLGLGRIYLPGPGLVSQAEANAACQLACTAGLPNLKNCQSVDIYHKCSKQGGDPFIPCGANGKGGYWYCQFYSNKITAKQIQQSGGTDGGQIRTSQAFVKDCK